MKMLLVLESRILFDGAALVTRAEVFQDTTTQDQAIPDTNVETEEYFNANTATNQIGREDESGNLRRPAGKTSIPREDHVQLSK
jgi:hypothetical protein